MAGEKVRSARQKAKGGISSFIFIFASVRKNEANHCILFCGYLISCD